MAEILAGQGCNVLTGRDVATALTEVRRRPIDVLFTESRWPTAKDFVGLGDAAQWPASQAVIVAAHASVETSIEALRHRVADFVLKPISELKIVSALERARPARRRRCGRPPGELPVFTPAPTHQLHPAHGDGARPAGSAAISRDWKQRLVREAVDQCHGNKAAAAQALGISRRTLYRILQATPTEES